MNKKLHSTIALLMAAVMVLTNVNFVHATDVTEDDKYESASMEELMEQKLEEFGIFSKSEIGSKVQSTADNASEGNDKGTNDGNEPGTNDGDEIPTEDQILHSGELHGIKWYISKDGVLIITGTNTSDKVELEEGTNVEDVAPWLAYSGTYTKVIIKAKNVKTTCGWFLLDAITEVDMSGWDTSTVEDMSLMFFGCTELKSLDLSKWNTSNLKNMQGIFMGCMSLTSLDLSHLDTSKVTTMDSMFSFCPSLASVNISNLDTSAVESMNSMFMYCYNLTSLDLSKLNTSAVTDMSGMFYYCSDLTELDLSSLNTSNVEKMASMFCYCEGLTNLDITKFDTQKVQDMSAMFAKCSALKTIDLSKLDTSNVTDMYSMFSDCTALTTLDVSSFNTAKLEDARYMFENCTSLESIKAFRNLQINIELPVSPMYDDRCNTYENIFPLGLEESVTLSKTSPMEGKMWVTEVRPQTYTGKAIKPAIKVYDGPTLLKEKVDYTISFKNNKNVNDASNPATAPKIIVKGKGNYSGQQIVTFKIIPIDLKDEAVVAKDIYVNANGKEQKPVPTITYNGKKLKNNKDFELSYTTDGDDAYTATGNYTITAKGKGNYAGERSISLVITNGTLMSKVKVSSIPKQEWTGNKIEPALNVTYKGATLVKGTDYTVTYKNNINTGKATATIIGMGNYAGTKDVNFQITGINIAKANVSGIVDKTYNGKAQTQNMIISVNGTILGENDYDITYSKNTNAGKASIVIIGKGRYSGTIKKTFKIHPYDLDKDPMDLMTGLKNYYYEDYVKGGVTLNTPPKFNGVSLVEKKDYTVTYKNNKTSRKAGKPAYIIVKGKGNFTGTRQASLYIYRRYLDDTIAPITVNVPDMPYSDTPGKFASTPSLYDTNGKKLSAGKDYDKNFTYFLDNGTILSKLDTPAVGTKINVLIKGKDNYTSSVIASYTITEASFNSAKIDVKSKVYTGKAVTLDKEDITVTVDGKTLTYGVDYEIVEGTYSNNVKKGTASVVVKGLGNYGGSQTVKYKITSKGFASFWNLIF